MRDARASVSALERVTRTYDARNRLTLVNYPDATADISTGYFPDGAVQWTTTGPVTTNYTYNKRRLLTSEQMVYGSTNWTTNYGYSALGDIAMVTYPDLHAVSFAPNALGQATQAGSYATVVTYHPNGAVKQFTYGNGLLHTMTQNARQLPETSRDALGTNVVMDDTYDYDYNGNVAGISDALPTNPGNRDMAYDALDRLWITAAGNPQGGYGAFEYDPLDNLRYLDQGPRQNRYTYDATGRLANIKNPAGTTLNTFAYDVRGNTLQRNAGDTFTFDRANRMLTASSGGSSYVYDALGRRVKETTLIGPSMIGSTTYQYSGAGQLLYADDGKTARKHNYIYLSGSLVAKRTVPNAGGPALVNFQHTDALGSLVAASDINGVAGRRERMTPYGEPADGVYDNGHGFTGHQNDAGTRLVYMQQRYYDPEVGRFLSNDPVATNPNTGGMFNRYAYATNNPYKFTDPDGRRSVCATQANCQTIKLTSSESPSSRLKKADAHIAKVERKLESRGNTFKSTDESARFFRDNFADEGRYLQVEFGANAEPGTNAIVDIVHSPDVDLKSGVGTQINIRPGSIGGASFHTHPDIRHSRPGFSWGDILTGRASANDFEYVFYGSPLSVGRKWDIRATMHVDAASIYHDQDTYAPIFD